jgi:ADP-heptose:LPS heptosyltransferase
MISILSFHKDLIRRLRAERYDVVIDFTHGDRAAFVAFSTGAPLRISYEIASRLSHLLMNKLISSDPSKHHIIDFQLKSLESLGLHDFNRRLELHVPEDVRKREETLLRESGLWNLKPKVVIHPGARIRFRLWSPDRFGEIARRLRDSYGAAIILMGGPEEGALVDEVEKQSGAPASLKTTSLGLLEMAALFSYCRLFLGNDSAPGHIAAAVNCPTLTLFGPTFPHMWRPYHSEGRVIFKDVPCCGCRQEVCIRPEDNCMDMIKVDEVWEVVKKMME